MEVLLAICGKDFVLTATDATAARSIVVMKQGEDKSRELTKHCLMLFSGEAGDTVNFAEFIQRNIRMYSITNQVPLSTKAASTFTRKELATSLRSRKPYQVNVLVGGVDPNTSAPSLFWIDHLSCMQKMDFAAHGYASYFCMSIMDRFWHQSLSIEEAMALLKLCLNELRVRFIGNFPLFTVKVIDSKGIRVMQL